MSAVAWGAVACVRRVVAFAVLALCVVGATPALAKPTLDAARLAELDRFEVLTFADATHTGIDRGKAIGVIEATPEEIFRVATDFARYKEYMPRITGAEQVARTNDGAQVVITADLPWPAGHAWIEADYKFENVAGGIYRIRFQMRRGNMRRYDGSLYIEPWGPRRASITYELVAEPDVLAPKSAVNRGVRRTVGKFVHALRQRINELHQLGMLHPIEHVAPTAAPALISPNPATLKARR